MGEHAGVATHGALGQHVVEQHRVDSPEQQVLVRMDVVVVGDGLEAVFAFGLRQDLPGQRGAERRHAAATEIGQRAVAAGVGLAHGQHFAELVVRHANGEFRALGRRVLETVDGNVEVAALHRLVERGEGGLHEDGPAAQGFGDERRHLDIEPAVGRRILRVGFDIRGAALGVGTPAQLRLLRGGRSGQSTREHGGHRRSHVKHASEYTRLGPPRYLSVPTRRS